MTAPDDKPEPRLFTRRRVLIGGAATAVAAGGAGFVFRKRLGKMVDRWTLQDSFGATPPLVPHDPAVDRVVLHVAQGASPAANIDAVLSKLGGIAKVVGPDDVVAVKVSAQWWNQGMTNVAAARRLIEHVIDQPGFRGEVVVF